MKEGSAMTTDKIDRPRPHLRLVVNNPDHRPGRPAHDEEVFISIEELVSRRDDFRPQFYLELEEGQIKAYGAVERFLIDRGLAYGLDPHHGKVLVIPAPVLCPELTEQGGSAQDEILVYVADDLTGQGMRLSFETILPFYSDNDDIMEDAVIFSPVLPYGTIFLEENRHDGYLDLIYRVSFPLAPPALTQRLLGRYMATVAHEIREALAGLAESLG
jgi:hypothetical protein